MRGRRADGTLLHDFSKPCDADDVEDKDIDYTNLPKNIADTIPFLHERHCGHIDRGRSVTSCMEENAPDAHYLHCSRHFSEELSRKSAVGKVAASAYHELLKLPTGAKDAGVRVLDDLVHKPRGEEALALLQVVEPEHLAPCFLPDGVRNFNVKTSNWIEIKFEIWRRIQLRRHDTCTGQCQENGQFMKLGIS